MSVDIQHAMGFDISLASTGDLALVDGDEAVRERVLRRLLTVQGAYIWQPAYGGGLTQFVGAVTNAALIQSVVRSQMILEPSVARQPLPTVSLSSVGNGTVTATITYASASTTALQQPTVTIGSL